MDVKTESFKLITNFYKLCLKLSEMVAQSLSQSSAKSHLQGEVEVGFKDPTPSASQKIYQFDEELIRKVSSSGS